MPMYHVCSFEACFPDIGYVVEACAIKHSQPRPSPRLGYAVAAQAITQNPWTVHVRYAEDPVHAFKVHAIAGPEQPQPAPEEPAADDPAADVPAAEVPAVEEPVPVSQEELAALQAQLQVTADGLYSPRQFRVTCRLPASSLMRFSSPPP